MPAVLLVKLGGSLLTDKTRAEAARPEVLARLAAEVAGAARALAGRGVGIVLGHGSGSFGHVAAARAGLGAGPVPASSLPGVAHTQERAAALHRQVVGALLAAGALPFSLVPSSFVAAAAGRPVAFEVEPLALALAAGLLPVLYGDVVLDREWGAAICSTETLFLEAAGRLPAQGWTIERAVWLGETAGVHDRDGRTLPHLADPADAGGAIGGAAGTDVTGGMRHRVEAALALARMGIPSLLADGRVPGLLERALLGDEVSGTRIG